MNQIQAGDLIQLIGPKDKRYIFRVTPGSTFQSHEGEIPHDDIIGVTWGSQIFSHLDKPFFALHPSLHDILLNTKRQTQIVYPKEIGFILLNLNVQSGQTIIEAGTGSGALTTALAYAIGEDGRIISYDRRIELQRIAIDNLKKLNIDHRVEFKIRDIEDGFDEQDVDSLFLDVPRPDEYLKQARLALKPGGFFGSIVPTTNQVSRLLRALNYYKFGIIEVCEIMLRYYKPVQERFRPVDRMVAHTGYLIFARSLSWADRDKSNSENATDIKNSSEEV